MRRSAVFLILFTAFFLASVSGGESAGVVLISRLLEGELPVDDPLAEAWGSAVPLKIPLSSQVNSKPRIYDATVSSLTVRSLNNGRRIAFLLEWDDPTMNARADKAEAFSDAVAIQHPVDLDKEKIWFCMGMPGAAVNIWHWKAAWEKGLTGSRAGGEGGEEKLPHRGRGWDYYPEQKSPPGHPSPVEDLNSAQMRTLTAQPAGAQNVGGKGVWRDGKWKVVFSRDFSSQDKGDTQFKNTEETRKLRPIAFAVWDGGNNEVNGRKAVSAFYFLDISAVAGAKGYGFALFAVFLTVGVEVAAVGWYRRRRKKSGSHPPANSG